MGLLARMLMGYLQARMNFRLEDFGRRIEGMPERIGASIFDYFSYFSPIKKSKELEYLFKERGAE